MNVRLYSAQYVRTVLITIFSSIICYCLVSILFCQCLSIIVFLRNKAPSFLLNVLLVILLFWFSKQTRVPNGKKQFPLKWNKIWTTSQYNRKLIKKRLLGWPQYVTYRKMNSTFSIKQNAEHVETYRTFNGLYLTTLRMYNYMKHCTYMRC